VLDLEVELQRGSVCADFALNALPEEDVDCVLRAGPELADELAFPVAGTTVAQAGESRGGCDAFVFDHQVHGCLLGW
jgi:hypothetical protein